MTVSTNLNDVLQGMGAEQMFDSGEANFDGLMPEPNSLYVSDVLHKANMGIDEIGVEAAAGTVVVIPIICFSRGTPIQTLDGDKPIEELAVGDLVVSRDEANISGPIGPKRIVEIFESRGEIMELHVGGKVIRTTAEHPFFVRHQGWVAVHELQPGDQLAADHRSWMPVEEVVRTDEIETVYNFHVEDYHTYFVGSQDWGFSIWVHNRCGGGSQAVFNADHPFHFLIRDMESSAIMFMGRVDDPTEATNSIAPKVPLSGDANGDDEVNFDDFLVLSENYGKAADATFAEGDFNSDGAIGFVDFLILSENYGQTRS